MSLDAREQGSITHSMRCREHNDSRSAGVAIAILSALFVIAGCNGVAFDERGERASAIVGGEPADIATHPWLVSIRAQLDPNDPSSPHCGGTILDEYSIVTAAHCFSEHNPKDLWIAAGISHGDDAGVRGQRREIASRLVHSSYRRSSQGNLVHGEYDIAVLRLAAPLDLSQPNVAAIERVTPQEEETLTAPGVVATIAGWGAIEPRGRQVKQLHDVSLPIVSLDVARGAYPDNRISDNQLAAGEMGVGGKDACVGDSGGPLVVHDPVSGRMKLAGIVSWGKECGDPDHPGMYARVSAYQAWIDGRIGEPFIPQSRLQFTTLTAEQYVAGIVDIEVTVDTNEPPARVEFQLPNGSYVDEEPPFQLQWDSRAVLDGMHRIMATAFSADGVPIHNSKQTIKFHVVNRPDPRPTKILHDFETVNSWRGNGGGSNEFKLVEGRSPESPHRGNRSLRYETREMLAKGSLYQLTSGNGRIDLTRYLRLRLWAKNLAESTVALRIEIYDRDRESWRSRSALSLTDAYQELQVELRTDQFERIEVGEEEGDGEVDFEAARITISFHDANPEQPDHVLVYVDDISADLKPIRLPASDADVLFDFESEDSNWLAFGESDPAVTSSIALDNEDENRMLRYTNGDMADAGGVTYPLENAVNLSHLDEIFFDARCFIGGEHVAFGFQDLDGEAWISSTQTFIDRESRQVRASLLPDDLTLAEVVPVEGVMRNFRPDTDKIKAFTFVFYGSGSTNCAIDNVIAPKATTVYEDAEDGTTRGWRIYDDATGDADYANVFDEERQSQVIELAPGISNPIRDGFMLETETGELWDNRDQFVAQWSMKFTSPTFFIYLDVDTTAGQRYIYYTNMATTVKNNSKRYIHIGLGAVNDGAWHTLTRNLQEDLQTDPQDEGERIISVRRFLVRGFGRLDDISLQ